MAGGGRLERVRLLRLGRMGDWSGEEADQGLARRASHVLAPLGRTEPERRSVSGDPVRHRGRTDGTQTEIVKALRKLGATVAVTSALGDGFPDLVVGWRGVNHLVEVKNGSLSPSKRELTPDEEKFHATWRGESARWCRRRPAKSSSPGSVDGPPSPSMAKASGKGGAFFSGAG